MLYIKYKTYSDALMINDRVTAECLRDGIWNGTTNNYCIPFKDKHGQWLVPIMDGYEKYFTIGEIDCAWDDADEVPKEVPLWCLRTVLKLMNLFSQVESAIYALPETTTEEIQLKTAAKEGLEYGNNVARKSATTLFVQHALSLTDSQVDQIFIDAYSIDA